MAILVALAGILVPLVSGVREDSTVAGTTASMQSIRNGIISAGSDRPGYLSDVGGLPATIRDLFVKPDGVLLFDRFTARGWRGPYMQGATGTYRIDASRGFLPAYGADDDPALNDAWGRSIIIQVPTAAADPDPKQRNQFARIVSAGADGILQTPADRLYPSLVDRGDDRLLFLLRSDIAP